MYYVKPRLSEKAFAMSQATNTYALDVPKELNKYEVADTIAKQFGVEIERVRVVNRKGKTKRIMNLTGKRSSNRKGSQADSKKAYVTLKAGHHLPFFQAEENEVKEADKAKKTETKKAETTPEKKTSVVKKLTSKVTKKEEK